MPDLSQAVHRSVLHSQLGILPVTYLLSLIQSLVPVLYTPSHSALLKHDLFLPVFSEKVLIGVMYYVVGFKSSVYLSRLL